MKYIVAIPDNKYYLWQTLVQINNFSKYGIDNDLIYVVSYKGDTISDTLNKFIKSRKIKSKFHLYKDDRPYTIYPSSQRPYILSKFFKEHKINEPIFYLDPDVIFTKKPNFDNLLNDDIWYVSDTRSYIDSKYIKSKSEKLFNEMCGIVRISPDLITSYDDHAGGAQYLMKNIPKYFWNKVYVDSENLYKHMIDTSKVYNPKHPIQAWTADMWAVLWNGIYYNNDVKIVLEMEFAWATDHKEKWDRVQIFHNAGVAGKDANHFSKVLYQDSPFKKQLTCADYSCSKYYIDEIKETENNYKTLIF